MILLIMVYLIEGVGFVAQATFLPDTVNTLPGLGDYGGLT